MNTFSILKLVDTVVSYLVKIQEKEYIFLLLFLNGLSFNKDNLFPIAKLKLIQSLVSQALPESTHIGGTEVGEQNKTSPFLSGKARC